MKLRRKDRERGEERRGTGEREKAGGKVGHLNSSKNNPVRPSRVDTPPRIRDDVPTGLGGSLSTFTSLFSRFDTAWPRNQPFYLVCE